MINLNSNEIVESLGDGQYETKYGIRIWSRYNHDEELEEMIEFCKLVSKFDFEPYITEVFYDSKASLCIITTSLDDGFDRKDKSQDSILIEEVIKTCALITITQFQLFGYIGHQNLYLRKLFHNDGI